MSIKLLELFGGIGACTQAMKRLGIDFEVVDYVEINKFAVNAYNAINDTTYKPQDITEWDKDLEVDFIMHGSPCQDFSVAGLGKGADEGSGTRSSLMYETVRIVRKLRPKYVLWENVKNALAQKNIHNFEKYLTYMEELGYQNHYQVINANQYGVPQNRERIFCLSILGESNYVFPEKQDLFVGLESILEAKVDQKFYLDTEPVQNFISQLRESEKGKAFFANVGSNKDTTDLSKLVPKPEGSNNLADVEKALEGAVLESKAKIHQIGNYLEEKGWKNPQRGRVYDPTYCAPCITTMQGGGLEPKILLKEGRVRKLTPLECWRLMGFSDSCYEKAATVSSNSQLYKQAGNSIVVTVLEGILGNIDFGEYKG